MNFNKKTILLLIGCMAIFWFGFYAKAYAATYYWVGSAGGNTSVATNWNTSPGSCASSSNSTLPTSSDNIHFGGTGYCQNSATVDSALSVNNFYIDSAYSGTVTLNNTLTVVGNLTLATGTLDVSASGCSGASCAITVAGSWSRTGGTFTARTGTVTFNGSSASTITSGGQSWYAVTVNGTGSWTMGDAFTATNTLTLTQGSFLNTSNYPVSVLTFSSNNSNTRALTPGSNTWSITAATAATVWDIGTSTGMTLTSTGSRISLTGTGAFAKTFAGGGLTYNNLEIFADATHAVTITGSNTFTGALTLNSHPMVVDFANGTTQTMANFGATGTAGNLITINSDTTATHALVYSGASVVSCDYLNIQHSVVSPANTWYAGTHSTNNQGVATAGSGWTFTAPPAPVASNNTAGSLYSVNIAAGLTINSFDYFGYNATIPANTTLKIMFSQDNVNWYSASHTLNTWTSLQNGNYLTQGSDTNLNLSGGWTSSQYFYYQVAYATTDTSVAPTLTSIQLFYNTGTYAAVSTGAATSVAGASATGNATVSSIGNSTITVEGFQYGVSTTNYLSVSQTGSYGTGSYSLTLPNLYANTTYYVRAFVTNAQGTAYGSWLTFTTTAYYNPSGTLYSTNLLTGQTVTIINSFYTSATVPSGTSMTALFSQDNTNWYNAAGVLNGTPTNIPNGATTTSLSALNWTTANFYYKITFNASSDYSATPTLSSVIVNYNIPTDSSWVGGSGNWSDAANHWAATSNGSPGAGNLPGVITNVHFDSHSGSPTVTIDSASVTVANFDDSDVNTTIATSTNGITITGDLTVNGTISGTTAITLNSASKTITGGSGATIFSPVVLGATRTVAVASGTFTMSGIISDGGNAYGLSKTGSGTLDLSGANTFTGGLTIKAGTVQGDTSASAFGGSGTGAITLGDTTGSNAATLLVGTTGLTFANAITLATNASVGTLTIGNTGTAISTIFSGGVTGTNSFTINSNATTGTIEFSTATVNNAGTITHIGAGSGTATISAVIGTNVTGLTQNSTTSALTLSGNNSTVSGNVTISAGTLSLSGTTNLNVSGNWSNSGTFTANSSTVTLTGTSAGGTITSGGSSFYKLTQNGSGGTYTLQDNTTVSNTLTITAGTLACATKNLTVTTALSNSGLITASTGAILIPNASSGAFTFTDANNIPAATYSTLTINASGKTDTLAGIVNSTNLTITAGTLDVSSSNYALNVSGNWSNSGIFNARNGTVTLNGTLQTISGTTTFYNLTKDVSAAAADTLTFTAGSAQTISHTLTLNGASGKVLTLVSSSTPTRWVLTLPVGAAYTVNYVNAKDSDASRGLAINATNSTDSGNNLNWGFGVNSVLTLSGFNPASGATITSAPVISFTLSVAGDCYAATTNWGYANMIANSAINCAGDGTTNGVCQMTDLGTNGSKTIYFACQDTFGNKNADGTDQSVTYTLSSPSGNQIIIKGKLKTQGMVKFK